MQRVFLLSCVKTKHAKPCEAQDLYTSTWFRAARTYIEVQHAVWYILSAKYGLLRPNEGVSPYDLTLDSMRADERRTWATSVLAKLNPLITAGDDIVFLAGKRYRQFLEVALKERGVRVRVPLEHLRRGEQVRWLQDHGSAPN